MPDWDKIIANICHLTGWTWDYVEETLTIPRLKALYGEWRVNPPLPIIVAAFLGVKPKEEGSTEELVERVMGLGS